MGEMITQAAWRFRRILTCYLQNVRDKEQAVDAVVMEKMLQVTP